MATPKKQTSPRRKGLRHAGQTHKLYVTASSTCPNCQEIVRPHAACPVCGYYKGRAAVEIKTKTKNTEETESTSK